MFKKKIILHLNETNSKRSAAVSFYRLQGLVSGAQNETKQFKYL
jgi:hypothetical protein